jgi:hypothetical protein
LSPFDTRLDCKFCLSWTSMVPCKEVFSNDTARRFHVLKLDRFGSNWTEMVPCKEVFLEWHRRSHTRNFCSNDTRMVPCKVGLYEWNWDSPMQGSFVQMALGRSHMKGIFIYLALIRSHAWILCFPGKGMLLYIHCYFRVLNVLGMCQSYLYFLAHLTITQLLNFKNNW